jgi:hypothetical protein
MDPRERTPPFENGVDCAVCGRNVPVERIRILASRDDLTFVDLTCAACRSESLGMILAGATDGPDGREPYGEFCRPTTPGSARRCRSTSTTARGPPAARWATSTRLSVGRRAGRAAA